MPTYQNRHGLNTDAGEDVFGPFETKKLKRPILIENSTIQLIDKEPEYNPYVTVIKKGKVNSKSDLIWNDYSRFIRIDDTFPEKFTDIENDTIVNTNPSNSTLSLGVFSTVGIHSNKSTFQLVRVITFNKKFGFWVADNPEFERIPGQILDSSYEVIYLQILALSGSTVDVSLKRF